MQCYAVVWIGLIASIAALFNLWPRMSFFVCFICFLSFVTAADAFSSYQSDSMLLEAGFLALFFAPPGLRPGLAESTPPSRASLFLLQWEWFRIYFESGIVKLLSGDPQWRNFTAMDEYYQNGPLPTWIGWYVEHLPHWFHATTVAATLAMELAVVWMLFLPRRARFVCFCIVTPWEIGVIFTANYTFLNYLVLSLGFLLLDDQSALWLIPSGLRKRIASFARDAAAPAMPPLFRTRIHIPRLARHFVSDPFCAAPALSSHRSSLPGSAMPLLPSCSACPGPGSPSRNPPFSRSNHSASPINTASSP